jgi:PIN domain nuclease of toxin-antitoxin system
MRVLLDTNAFIRWATGERIPRQVERLVQKASTECFVSIVTPWEIAILNGRGRIEMSAHRVEQNVQKLGARLLPITMAHTAALYGLPQHHHDPFDRILIAQALLEGLAVITSDEFFRAYQDLKVIW